MNTRTRRLAVFAITVGLIAPLNAKGPTVRLNVQGASLSQPLDVTDSQVLSDSNIYEGSFIGPVVLAPGQSVPRYMVSFHVDLPKWLNAGVQMKYVVYYAKNAQTGEGFVYLPGPGDEWYRLNASTILRDGQDGRWHRASERWATALNRFLP